MSIILKALKKIQEQEAGKKRGALSGETAAGERSSSDALFASASPQGAREAGAGVVADSSVFQTAKAGKGRFAPPQIEADSFIARYRFGFAPKALLGLFVAVGVVTMGWFGSKIYYLNLKPAPGMAASEMSAAAVEEPAEYARAVEATPAQSEKTASELLPTPPLADVEDAAPLETAPALIETPEPQVARASVAEPAPLPTPAPPPAAVATHVAALAEPEQTAPAMKETAPEKQGRPEFKINAIAWKSEEPKAIVNMQSVYEGDVIEGATVLAIKRKMIVFEYEGETFEVRF